MHKDFAVFILSHGRPGNVVTYNSLKRCGYTGKIYIIIDNEDKSINEYKNIFGNKVIVFDKKEVSESFDEFDNFSDRRSVVYGRNASFEIAKNLGVKYFLQLDDDYYKFEYRINHKMDYPHGGRVVKKNLDAIFDAYLNYYKSINALSIAMGQGGDWFAGSENFGKVKRKAMNSFFCSINRPFKFVGRINEDVNTYTWFQGLGNLFLTVPFTSIGQFATQSNNGGMTGIYLGLGTYTKSFYTIICAPSFVKIKIMGSINRRLHHRIEWDKAVPKILNVKYRK